MLLKTKLKSNFDFEREYTSFFPICQEKNIKIKKGRGKIHASLLIYSYNYSILIMYPQKPSEKEALFRNHFNPERRIPLKRIVSCLFAVILLFGLWSAPVSAEAVTLEQVLDCTAFTADASGEGWAWKHASKSLTLTNANLSFPGDGISLPDGAVLRLAGENHLYASGIALRTQGSFLFVEGVSGTGRLTVHNSAVGIQASSLSFQSGGPMLAFEGVRNSLALTGGVSINSGSIFSKNGFDVRFNSEVSLREDGGSITSAKDHFHSSAPVIAGKTHTLTATPSGDVTEVTGGGTYICGETVTLKASPADKFEEWESADIQPERQPTVSFVMPAKDVSVKALPVPRTTIVRFEVANKLGGTIKTDPQGENFPLNSVINIEAIPDAGYVFVGWTADNGSLADAKASKTQYTASSKKGSIITATFAKAEANVTVTASAGGTVNKVTGKYSTGSQVTLIATPNEGYTFVGWEGPAELLSAANAPQCVLTVPQEDVTVTARFEKIKHELTIQFDATLGSVTVGGVSHKSEGKLSLAAGEQVTLSAVPADKKTVFLGWVDALGAPLGTDKATTITFTMPAQSTSVTALFGKDSNPLHVIATEGGTVLVGSETGEPAADMPNAPMGSSYTFYAKPNNGYIFTGWSVSVGSLEDSLSPTLKYTMPAAEVTLTANFTKASFNLKISLTQGGSVSPSSGRQEVGAQIELVATPQEGYRFVGWELTCYGNVSSEGYLSDPTALKTILTMPPCSCQITAKFATADGTILTTAPSSQPAASTNDPSPSFSQNDEDAPIEGTDEGFPLWIILMAAAILAALGVLLVVHRERRMRNGHASVYRELFAKHNMKNLQKQEARRLREENEEDEE